MLNVMQCASYSNLYKHIEVAAKTKRSLFIHGAPGIGKTYTVRKFAEKTERKLIDIRVAQVDREFLAGIAIPDLENKTVVTLYKKWQYLACTEPCVVFFDELSNAPSELQDLVFRIANERETADMKLHPDTVIIAAGNLGAEDGTFTHKLSSALASRFRHVKFSPSFDETLAYMKANNFEKSIIAFLCTHPEFTNLACEYAEEEKIIFPTQRTWEIVSNIMHDANKNPDYYDDEFLFEILSGEIGVEVSAQFLAERNQVIKECPKLKDYINMTAEQIEQNKPKSLMHVNFLVDELEYFISKECKNTDELLKIVEVISQIEKIEMTSYISYQEVGKTMRDIILKALSKNAVLLAAVAKKKMMPMIQG